jgi:hypothetical protein
MWSSFSDFPAVPLRSLPNRSKGMKRADDGIRTRDPHLGKVMRYQLRYVRTEKTL